MLATLTGAGLSAAAGLNAYIPFLIVALIARYTDAITLPTNLEWISSPWAIGIAAVLLVSEIVLDKIPLVDSLNDAVGTVIRPATGGIIFAATTAAHDIETNSTFFQENSWIGIVLGIVVALLVHSGKMAARPVINSSTAGLGAPVASTAEDTTSLGLSLIAIFAPVLVIFALLVLALILFFAIRKAHRIRKRRRMRRTEIIYTEAEAASDRSF